MKNIFLLIGFAFFFVLPAKAQISLGIEGGYNFSRVSFKDSTGIAPAFTTKTGIKAGIVVDIKLPKGLSLQPGIFYTMKGFVYTAGIAGGGYAKNDMRVNYLEVPVNIQGDIVKIPGVGIIYIGAGPYFSYAIGGKWKTTFPGLAPVESSLKIGNTASNDIKSLDIGADANFGFKFNFGLFVRAQYEVGITNVSPTSTQRSIRNNGLTLSVGYLF